jgi:hypothetical protein
MPPRGSRFLVPSSGFVFGVLVRMFWVLVLVFRVLVFRVLVFRVLAFRVLAFRVLVFRVRLFGILVVQVVGP